MVSNAKVNEWKVCEASYQIKQSQKELINSINTSKLSLKCNCPTWSDIHM